MSYPGTKFNLYDQSQRETAPEIATVDNSPLFMVVGSFDKGPEDLMEISGTKFNELFGKMSFTKHGQNAIQAQRIINAGGKLLLKRVCAENATIANLIMVATVTEVETAKVNANGEVLYIDANTGEETTEATSTVTTPVEDGEPITETVDNEAITIKSASIKWEAKSISGCKTFEDVEAKAKEMYNDEAGVYPLFIFTDNGRGATHKAVRIIPDYNTSKGIGKTFYALNIFEGTTSIESISITLDPTVIYSSTAYGLDKSRANQVLGVVSNDIYDSYVAKLSEISSISEDELRNNDLIYGYTYKGSEMNGIAIDAESVDFNADYGVELKEGSNGDFGDAPVNTPAWIEAIRKVYAGEVTDEVWDVDQHKIAAVIDANFPLVIKNAIADFVTFREDCVYFRDFGTDVFTFIQIKAAYEKNEKRNRYIPSYSTTYEVKDPMTKKNIRVTMLYDMAECLVEHFTSSPFVPLAGFANRFILKEAIKGTINFTPIKTPNVDQKQAMEDLKINYAIFEGDDCVVQTLYTSQEANTELSFVNNVIAVQEVMRAVRTACPKNRHILTNGSDMSSYAKAVNKVLDSFRGHFHKLTFTYTKDPLKASQKLFYAGIGFQFNQWAQSEDFDLFAFRIDED